MLQKRNVLVISKNEDIRRTLCHQLKNDYEVLEATDVFRGLKKLDRCSDGVSVIMLGVCAQEEESLGFLTVLKEHPIFSTIPVIAVNEGMDKTIAEKCYELGISDCINQPLLEIIILRRIENVIRLAEATNELKSIEYDDLTGLYTKQAFLYHANELLLAHPEKSYDIIIADIDNFKLINTIYGEDKADALLKTFAKAIRKIIRYGVYARYGADQFVVITEKESARSEAWVTEQLEAFDQLSPVPNVAIKVGIYANVDRALSVTGMCDCAVFALRSVKHHYERSCAYYDGPISKRHVRRSMYEARFPEAIKNKEFVVWYQPKYDPYTEKVVGAEALVRWQQEDGSLYSPAEFLDVFEENGLIRKLDEYVFRQVCEQMSKWKEKGIVLPISVNLSRNSMHRDDVVERYLGIVEEYGISPKYIPIEITETAAVGSMEIKRLSEAIHQAGFPLNMDDFGSGRSSLHTLNVLEFDAVKLDKGLVDYIGDNGGEKVLMYTMGLAKELGMHIVAEGVEEKTQLEFLKDNACDAIQGYYYSKPLPADAFEQKVAGNLGDVDGEMDNSSKYSLTFIEKIENKTILNFLDNVPGGFLVYEADTEEKVVYSNKYLWKMFGCDSEGEFMEWIHGSFRGIVCPEELDRVEAEITEQILNDAENEMDCVEYHIQRKDGQKVAVIDYGHLEHPDMKDYFYVFVIEADKI